MIATTQTEEETLRWVFDAVPSSRPPNMALGETKSGGAKCKQSHCVKGMESSAEIGSLNGTEVGEDESLRTVECLRGRLLAERQASKVANETAEILGNKLIELENKLKEEIKLRAKADRKLKLLKEKLQSLNISCTSEESDQSYSPEKFSYSCGSSTADSVSNIPAAENPTVTESLVKNASGASTSNSQANHSATSNSNISFSWITHDENPPLFRSEIR